MPRLSPLVRTVTIRRHALPLLAAALACAPLGAQGRDDPAPAGAWQVGTFAGAAKGSPGNGILGTIPRRDHVMLGLQAGTTVLRMGGVSLNYIAQLLPFVMINDRDASRFDAALDSAKLARIPAHAYAVGIAPFGLELSTSPRHRVSGFLQSAGGGLIFSRPFPDVTGRRTNFTLEAGFGLRIRTVRGQWTQLGYKYHHISNAGTAFANPGLDGNLVYAGYQWTARLPR